MQDGELVVHARLIADLDRGGQVTEEPAAFLDDRVLGLPGQVRAVVIGQVVVEDARLGRLAGDDVPHRLIQAARDQVPVRKSEHRCPGKHLDQRGIARQKRPQASQLLIEGEPAVTHDSGLPSPAPHDDHDEHPGRACERQPRELTPPAA